MTRVLVLGSRGQIGAPLTTHLKERGHKVIEWDKKIGPYRDIADNRNIQNLIADFSASDTVVFLAFSVGGSKFLAKEDKRYPNIEENVRIMANAFLAQHTTETPCLFSSSQMSNMLHTNYGMLKSLGERYCASLHNTWVCRFWNVYGPEDPTSRKSHVITDFIHKARTKGKVEMLTDGRERRQFLHVDDCTRAITMWIEDPGIFPNSLYKTENNIELREPIDITSFHWTSVREVGQMVSDRLGVKCILGPSKDNIQLGIENEPRELIKKIWRPEISLELGISHIIEGDREDV